MKTIQPTEFRSLLELLSSAGEEFIIVGGVAASALICCRHTIILDAFDVSCRRLDLDTLIHVKRAAGRPKDFEALAELETVREQRQQGHRS